VRRTGDGGAAYIMGFQEKDGLTHRELEGVLEAAKHPMKKAIILCQTQSG